MHAIKLAIVCALLSQTVSLQSTLAEPSIGDGEAAKLVKEGEAAAASQEWRSAAQDFIRASACQTWKKMALYDLGVAYSHLGGFASALDCERQVAQIDEKFVPAYVQMGTILTKMGDYGGAEVALKKALELEPESKLAQDNMKLLRSLAQASTQPKKDDTIQAVKIFDGSETPATPTAQANNEPIEIVLPGEKVSKDTKLAVAVSTPTGSAPDSKAADAEVKTQLSPPATTGGGQSETASALTSAADLLKGAALQPSAAALAALAAAPQADPAQQALEAAALQSVRQQRVNDTIMEATVYFNSGGVDSARKTLLAALKIDEKSSLAHANLGVVLGTQGDFEGEVKEERRACQLDAKNAEAHLNLAWALAKTKKFADAAGQYDRALELDGKLTEAQSGQAYMLAKMGKKREAIAQLMQAREQNGGSAWPCTALGAIYIDDKSYEDAALMLKEALVRDPDNNEALKRSARLAMQTGKWQEAIDKYSALLNRKPYDLDGYIGLAQAKEKSGDKENALKALQTAAELAPANAEVHTSLSSLLQQLGRTAEAKKEAHTAQQIRVAAQ